MSIEPTDEEREILDCLAEECAETIQRCTKIQRFGLGARTVGERTNIQKLSEELGHAQAAMLMTASLGLVDLREVKAACAKKLMDYSSGTVLSRATPELRSIAQQLLERPEFLK